MVLMRVDGVSTYWLCPSLRQREGGTQFLAFVLWSYCVWLLIVQKWWYERLLNMLQLYYFSYMFILNIFYDVGFIWVNYMGITSLYFFLFSMMIRTYFMVNFFTWCLSYVIRHMDWVNSYLITSKHHLKINNLQIWYSFLQYNSSRSDTLCWKTFDYNYKNKKQT